MNWNTARPWLGTLARLVLGVVWIWSSLAKLASPRTFVQAVRAYDATPEWLSKAIGYGLPVLELALGILLIVGIAVRLSAVVSGGLMLFFLVGVIQASARGLTIDCGCFGGGGPTTSTNYTWDILRDLGLLVLAVYLVLWSMTRLSIEEYVARHDYIEPPSAKRLRTDKGARKYNAMLEARRKEAQSRDRYLNLSLAVIIVLVALIGIGVQAGRARIAGSLSATNASPASGVVFGKKAAATLDVYEDFQCPNCLNFEKAVGTTIDSDVRANKAQVRFHTISILDGSSNGNRYASRAANAALCASDQSVDDFVAFHNLLYGTYQGAQVQPAEGSNGRPNTDFIKYAQQIGLGGDKLTTFTSCVTDETHKALVQAITERASEKGISSTPTVLVNGKQIANTLVAYQKAVADALKKGPAPDPSKTPTPTPTPSVPPTKAATTAKASTPTPSTSATKK
ncbi:MAG TPA: MauE/DoxX family redox-associated membrane protein [Jatrophihabitans sp.]|uniref:MauE/DoxX family redox-associated membrane protein n=1 Tax=Jatrophihabitans sp. TaxID=1932789 RepID=UPI002DFFE0E5|nr:MauE/DoxX family redox-associated membrane protein [Jatrophihabitans sp.]